MAVAAKNLAIGGAVISVADWVANGAASSFTDVGLTHDGSELSDVVEQVEIGEGEQTYGGLDVEPVKRTVEIKCVMGEADLTKLQWILSAPSADFTGTAPNTTGLVGYPTRTVKTVKIVTKSVRSTAFGTRGTLTITAYLCYVKGREPVKYAKGETQKFAVTFGVLQDESLSTNDKYYKMVVAGAA